MSNIFNQVKLDDSDPRYVELKEKFTQKLMKKFANEDYNPIIE